MKLDAMTLGGPLSSIPEQVRHAEEEGYDGWLTGETGHDAFLVAAMAAEHTSTIEVGTGIAVAFGRSPMTVAYQAHDLQELSAGRFTLGLGTQVKPHIERRFGMPWSKPAARMREYVRALRAIWAAWDDGEKLEFDGEFYRHTLMTPFFSPSPSEHGAPRVALAAVGPLMTEVCGENCDLLLGHAFTTPEYFDAVTRPALAAGADRAGRSADDIEVGLGLFTISGYDDEQRAAAEHGVKSQIAFYGSTPAYRRVLEHHGWGELQSELQGLTREGKWDELPDHIDDEVVDAFAIRAEPGDLADAILERWSGRIDRLSLYTSFELRDEDWSRFVEQLRAAG